MKNQINQSNQLKNPFAQNYPQPIQSIPQKPNLPLSKIDPSKKRNKSVNKYKVTINKRNMFFNNNQDFYQNSNANQMHKPGELPDFTNPYGNYPPNQQINPQRNPLEYLQNFFGGFGVEFPIQDIVGNNPHNIQNNSSNNNSNNDLPHTRKRTKTVNYNNIQPKTNSNKNKNVEQIIENNVHRHNFGSEVYDNSFQNYGSSFDDRFQNNYSSNFRSNLENDVFNFLMDIIQGHRFESVEKKHPPTKLSVLNNLKKFDLNETYCKKNEKGEIEFPNCCICISDIVFKQKAVLLPCGHILHWKCGQLWLKKNNTCPLCRFELPGEKNFK